MAAVNKSAKTIEKKLKEGMPLFIKMAIHLVPTVGEEITSWIEKNCLLSGRTYWYVNLKKEEWVECEFLSVKRYNANSMALMPALHLQLIERYKDEKLWEKEYVKNGSGQNLFDDVMPPTVSDWLLLQMVNFLQGKPYLQTEDLDAEYSKEVQMFLRKYESVIDLLIYAMHQPLWTPFMQAFTRFAPSPIHNTIKYTNVLTIRPLDDYIEKHYYMSDPAFSCNDVTRDVYQSESFIHILRGDIKQAKVYAALDLVRNEVLEAVFKAYEGDSLEAYRLFSQKYIITNDYSFKKLDSFVLFVYVICLKNVIERSLDGVSKEAVKILKYVRKDLKKTSKVWMELIAAKTMGEVIDREKTLPKLLNTDMNSYDMVLTDIVLRFFYGMEEPATEMIKMVEKCLDVSGYRLLRMEWLHSMPEHKTEYETLRDSIGVKSPLINGAILVPKWERLLDELAAQTEVKETTIVDNPVKKQARIVYNIWTNENCSEFSFTPRLQKSTDGITWTGGRNVALKNFGPSTEGVTDLDIQISRHVKTYTEGWYGTTTYDLRGKEVLELLCGHPNVYLSDQPDTPVQIVKEDLRIIVERSNAGFVIKSNIDIGDNIPLLSVKRENTCLLKIIKISVEQRNILRLLSHNNTFPKEAETKLTKVLSNISRHTTVMSDMLRNAESNAAEIKTNTLLTIRLHPATEGVQGDVLIKPFGESGPGFQPGYGAEVISSIVDGKALQTKRNLKKEKEHLEAIRSVLYEYADEVDGAATSFSCSSIYGTLQLLDALYPMEEHCRLEWPEGERCRIARRLDAQEMRLSVKGINGWFEVDGEIKVSENRVIQMAELLERLRESKGRFIQIGDTEFIAISEQLRKQLSLLESMSIVQRKKVQISQFSTNAIESIKAAGVVVDADQTYVQLLEKIHHSNNVRFTLPQGLQTELRDYQKDGVQWMAQLASWGAGACLADDMGLGKTLQAITMMLSRKDLGATLVVVPTSVAMNWRNEVNRFAPQLNVLLLNQTGQDRIKIVNKADSGDVVIVTYGLLVTEEEILCNKVWNMIVLDEAHIIKNKETKMSQSAMQLQGGFRLLLTGTPLQNHLGELWNLFQFCNPGLLGSHKQFIDKFIVPIEKLNDIERLRQLKRMVTPFILRRTKDEVLDELPEKSEITIEVQLSEEEMAVYENLRRKAVLSLENGEYTPVQTLAEITKLRQAACNVRLINDKLNISSSKLTTLMNMVNNLVANGHRALIFSQFTSHLSLVQEVLDEAKIEYLYLDGACTARERERLVKDFQSGSMPLFLISLKAGGTGLNLTAADYVFHLDPWWNPAIEDQASDRTYRIGQTRPVTVYRLIAQQTIEEKIIRLHGAKKSLADSLLSGTNASHKLTKEEILQLLK